ncbi:MAG: hypothetical protein AAF564_09010 [Bacteroidota bacterium]
MWQSIVGWFMGLGAQYGVNPIIFGSIYVGAIPFFTLSLGWFIRNLKQKKPIAIPALSAGFFFISAYLYLLIAGQNIPVWVYGVVALLIIFGVYTTVNKVRAQIAQDQA